MKKTRNIFPHDRGIFHSFAQKSHLHTEISKKKIPPSVNTHTLVSEKSNNVPTDNDFGPVDDVDPGIGFSFFKEIPIYQIIKKKLKNEKISR